jgi:hypothetical protein
MRKYNNSKETVAGKHNFIKKIQYFLRMKLICRFDVANLRLWKVADWMADCVAIVNELVEVDCFSHFSGKRMDCCDGMELL